MFAPVNQSERALTVCIAIVLPESVLAIADGRTSVIGNSEVTSDQTQKIFPLGDQLSATILGVSDATSEAIRRLREAPLPDAGPRALAIACECLSAGWALFRILHPSAPLRNSAMRAALILSGVDSSGPYIAAAMIDSQQGLISVGPVYKKGANLVLGSEKHNSSDIFLRHLHETDALSSLTVTETTRALLVAKVAGSAILEVARLDPSVGGRIHYRALMVNSHPLHGIIV
jgi:hypothetical protein